MAHKFISWRRVSTFKQNRSGLGLEAQKEIIRYFIERESGEWIADYSECYTGKELSGCVELRKAIEHCKRVGAVLIIAKSDRFRNTAEALKIYEEMGEGNIMFCDLPTTDKFTLTLFFALAEREALIVSIRTKQALNQKKVRGEKLGGATKAWKDARASKTQEQLANERKKGAATKRMNFLQSRETQMFIKALRKAFPNATIGEPSNWNWKNINTKGDNKFNVLIAMKDIQDLDPTGKVFEKWDFDGDVIQLQVKLAIAINTLKRSIK